ncbi:MAG TPA: substrate-binding domain-containing protein, partial [Thermoanaerobaculia bacterium]
WEELAPRVVPALDVRANLAAVASGSVPAGVVYATDAASSARVEVLYRVPRGRAPQVVYWAAPVRDTGEDADGRRGRAERLLGFLAGPEAGALFERHGFRHLPTAEAGDA